MVEIKLASPQNYEELLAFANKIFWHSVGPHGFAHVLPKIYDGRPEYAVQHVMALEEGTLIGEVLFYHQNMQVGNRSMVHGGIATVAVSSAARGKGCMGRMLTRVNEEMEKAGFALATLDGDRQRYENYGYYHSGLQLRAVLTGGNLRHLYPETSLCTLVPLTEESPYFAPAYALYHTLPQTFVRKKEDFIDVLKSWGMEPFAILRGQEFLGYVTTVKRENRVAVDELVLKDYADLLAVCDRLIDKTIANDTEEEIIFTNVPFFQPELAKKLLALAGDTRIETNRQVKIFDYVAVLGHAVDLKNTYDPMADGRFAFSVEEKSYQIVVKNGVGTVEEIAYDTTLAGLSHKTAAEILFSLQALLPNDLAAPKGWLPLPLFIPRSEGS